MDNETIAFEQVVAKGCGLDVHKETFVTTVLGIGIKKETRTVSTFTCSLKEWKEWILSLSITHVALEYTGIYWKPVFNIWMVLTPNFDSQCPTYKICSGL